jgi:hypothetical protein
LQHTKLLATPAIKQTLFSKELSAHSYERLPASRHFQPARFLSASERCGFMHKMMLAE